MAEMPQSVKEILEEVKYFQDRYFTFDEPIPYKGLFLYPVKVKDYNEFLSSTMCLTLNKNDDFEGLRMTNVEYLIHKMNDAKEGPLWSLKFTKIVELCLHVTSGFKCYKCGKFLSFEEFYKKISEISADATPEEKRKVLLCDCGEEFSQTLKYQKGEDGRYYLMIDNIKITNDDFNKIRKYIMYQNLPDYQDDSWVNKELRDDMAAYNEIKGRNSGTASLERKILGMMAHFHWSMDTVINLSIRKFLTLLNLIDEIINYTTTKTGLMSGMVSLPKGETLEHWLYKEKEKKNIYDGYMDHDSYINQINTK